MPALRCDVDAQGTEGDVMDGYDERLSQPPEPKCTRCCPGACYCMEQDEEEESNMNDSMTAAEFVFRRFLSTPRSDVTMEQAKADMQADLALVLAGEREAFKDIFIWRDGEPYYYTRHGMPMEIPERIIKKIKAAIRQGA